MKPSSLNTHFTLLFVGPNLDRVHKRSDVQNYNAKEKIKLDLIRFAIFQTRDWTEETAIYKIRSLGDKMKNIECDKMFKNCFSQ